LEFSIRCCMNGCCVLCRIKLNTGTRGGLLLFIHHAAEDQGVGKVDRNFGETFRVSFDLNLPRQSDLRFCGFNLDFPRARLRQGSVKYALLVRIELHTRCTKLAAKPERRRKRIVAQSNAPLDGHEIQLDPTFGALRIENRAMELAKEFVSPGIGHEDRVHPWNLMFHPNEALGVRRSLENLGAGASRTGAGVAPDVYRPLSSEPVKGRVERQA